MIEPRGEGTDGSAFDSNLSSEVGTMYRLRKWKMIFDSARVSFPRIVKPKEIGLSINKLIRINYNLGVE